MTDQTAGHDVGHSIGTVVARVIGLKAGRTFPPFLDIVRDGWSNRTLSTRFVIASSFLILITMLHIGAWVDGRIRKGGVQSAASATARYMELMLQPKIQELASQRTLSASAKQRIAGLFEKGELERSIVQIKIWLLDGTLSYTSQGSHLNEKRNLSAELTSALTGQVVAKLAYHHEPESSAEGINSSPIFEVFAPMYENATHRMIAIAEFHEDATSLSREFTIARQQSWLVVGLLTFGMLSLLFGIVHRGSLLILHQKEALETKLEEQTALLKQNDALRARLVKSHHNSVALSDKILRRVGADLHDGPAQLLSLALLRLHELEPAPSGPVASASQNSADALNAVRAATQDALAEIRNISAGVSLPEIENLKTCDVLNLAVSNHERRSRTVVRTEIKSLPAYLPPALSTCVFRCVQEGLNNSFHHAAGRGQFVSAESEENIIKIIVKDSGPGFSPALLSTRNDGLGLVGLRYRIESFGGVLDVSSCPGTGTTLSVKLPHAGLS